MLFQDISVGHIAKSRQSSLLVLVGIDKSYYLNYGLGWIFNNNEFHDDYEDLGELKVTVEEVKQYKVSVSVG